MKSTLLTRLCSWVEYGALRISELAERIRADSHLETQCVGLVFITGGTALWLSDQSEYLLGGRGVGDELVREDQPCHGAGINRVG